MKKAAEQIDRAHQSIHKLQTTLSGQINALRAGWSGQASDAFYRAYSQFDDEFQKVKNGLEEIHGKLVDSHVRYTTTEADVKAASNPIFAIIDQSN